MHLDHLGTPRLMTAEDGHQIGLHAYYPFGEGMALPSESPAERLKFTGHERDDSGLDYMHARYYGAVEGRFLSVDPVLGTPDQPQSWNRYAYARNQPLTHLDPDGRTAIVDRALQAAVDYGREHSAQFAADYDRVANDPRIVWWVRSESDAAIGTRAHTVQNPPQRDANGVITHTVQASSIPTRLFLQQQAERIAHELAHNVELLDTNRTLAERYAKGAPGVELNLRAGPNAYESTFAKQREATVHDEFSQYTRPVRLPKGRKLSDLPKPLGVQP
jgi:RHS repeat-associated protein